MTTVLFLVMAAGWLDAASAQNISWDQGISVASILEAAREETIEEPAAREPRAVELPSGYRRAIPNTMVRRPDGTVLILRPSTGGMGGRWISSASDPDGVCKFFGLENSVAIAAAPLPIAVGPVVISADGQPAGDSGGFGGYLNAIVCGAR